MHNQPIACILDVIPAEARAAHQQLSARLFAIAPITELEDGYRFTFSAAALVDVAQYIAYERLCCPFITFNLSLLPNGETIDLDMTGRADVKAFLTSEFTP